VTRGVIITGLVISAVLTAGFAYYHSRQAIPRLAPVTASITRGNVVDTVDATGTVEALTTVQVGTQVSGTIQSLYADFNSKVRQGQVIAKLDPSLFQTQVDQAEATLMRLQADMERSRVDVTDTQRKLERARALYAQQLVARTDLDTAETNALQAQAAVRSAEAQVTQARASLNQAQVNLAHTVISAPIDGIVISRNVDVGQTVAATMQAPTLFVIARDLTRMQVRASVNEADVGAIQTGQPVTFRVDAYPDETFSGAVTQVRLQPIVEQNVVSYTTVIDVPNAALRFRPTAELFAGRGQTPAASLEHGGAPVSTVGRARQTAQAPERSAQAPPTLLAERTEGAGHARVWVLRGRPAPTRERASRRHGWHDDGSAR
jgi:HlyD family secretion protein